MKTVALVSQKGGSGKTTLALNLAIAATKKRKNVVVIDIDPQQSAVRWARLRAQDSPVIVSGHGPNLAALLQRAKDNGADLVLIDTAPKSESAALAAAKLSDLVIIPCQPSSLDLDAIADTANIVALAKSSALVVLNNCRASSHLSEQAKEALAEYTIPVAQITLGSRVAFIKSLALGQGVLEYEPRGAAAREIAHLYTCACKQGGM